MTYNVLMGMLNPTHSLTHWCWQEGHLASKLQSTSKSPN